VHKAIRWRTRHTSLDTLHLTLFQQQYLALQNTLRSKTVRAMTLATMKGLGARITDTQWTFMSQELTWKRLISNAVQSLQPKEAEERERQVLVILGQHTLREAKLYMGWTLKKRVQGHITKQRKKRHSYRVSQGYGMLSFSTLPC